MIASNKVPRNKVPLECTNSPIIQLKMIALHAMDYSWMARVLEALCRERSALHARMFVVVADILRKGCRRVGMSCVGTISRIFPGLSHA